MLAVGAFLSYKIKDVEMSLYNDSKIIGFSVNFIFFIDLTSNISLDLQCDCIHCCHRIVTSCECC